MKNYQERAKRLKKVYGYLVMEDIIETQKDMALKIKMTPPNLSAAMKGNKSYLSDNTFIKVCAAFPGVFNLDYLLYGEGEMLANSYTHEPIPLPQGEQVDDIKEIEHTNNLFDLAMQVIKDNEALHRQLKASIAEIRSLIDRYGPVIEAERMSKSSPRQYPSMVAEDLDKSDGKN
jgi:hypothetical protein